MAQQAVKFFLANRVALACAFFEAGSILDRDQSATVVDKFLVLQLTSNLGHASAPYT